MRAGNLDREIKIQTYSATGVDDYGAPLEAWADLATLRAQIVQASTEEFIRGYGEASETTIIFRTHYLEGVTTIHRVEYESEHFNILEVKEFGRRKGLELRCQKAGS